MHPTTPQTPSLSGLEDSLNAMRRTSDRLRQARNALASGQFDPPADAPEQAQEALQSLAQRLNADAQQRSGKLNGLADTLGSLFEERTAADLHASMTRLDGLRRFNLHHVQGDLTPSAAASQPQPAADADVIDVQARDISPSAAHSPTA